MIDSPVVPGQRPADSLRPTSGDAGIGARTLPGGGTSFRLWAPAAASVDLQLTSPDGTRSEPMRREGGAADPWFTWETSENLVGRKYAYLIDSAHRVPDPASRWNPDDVHGDSMVVASDDFVWQANDWLGIPWHRAVIYELHVGTFTAAGTFIAAIDRLDHLVALGITAIEVMPVADFPGQRNWGYDGVLHYAPDASYGSPDDLRRFIDAAHSRGIAVFLDVVYNHFGPDGNYLSLYAPGFFTERHRTPWGAAVNFDDTDADIVRRFYIDNAWYWIDSFRLDGLRFDAVHAIHDESPTHLITELAQALRMRLADQPGPPRQVHLILENDHNDAALLRRLPDGQPVAGTAQWNDGIHHALHVLVTGEVDGYYANFADAPARRLADGLARGFVRIGTAADGNDHALPPTAFINFLQNHDQIGNRAGGERIDRLASPAAVRAAAACVLLGPAIPMLYMGEEFAASTPFLYFCDFDGELATAVRDGRRQEFAHFSRFADPAVREQIPDPCAVETFERSRLDWTELAVGPHAERLAFHRDALSVRRACIEPLLASGAPCRAQVRMLSERAFIVRWQFDPDAVSGSDRRTFALAVNFDPDQAITIADAASEVLFSANDVDATHGQGLRLGAFGVALIR